MRKIPATMATQHPDNACSAYFLDKAFISAKAEIEECFRCYSELDAQEYMWDWEGKFVDESVIDRMYNEYFKYFQKQQIGRDRFLTFRIPNIWIESKHKLPRAFMNMISAENAAKNYDLHSPPLFEIILPMTSSSEQLIYLQKAFSRIAHATEEIFEMKSHLKQIEVIPLFENPEAVHKSSEILKEYVDFIKKAYGKKPQYLRVFTARSDPAMNIGFLPAKLLSKIALSLYHEFGKKNGIKIYPIVGCGCLPFRGGLNPENISAAIEEYKGVATVTVQSAFRYDYDVKEVKKSIKLLNEKLPQNLNKYVKLSEVEIKKLEKFNQESAKFFRGTIEPIAGLINDLAQKLPQHRERVQHIGLFGYSRGMGKVKLPRAIMFTGAFYSIGVPPELIGAGRALRLAVKSGLMPLIEKLCPYLREDFIHAGHYLNRENLDLLCKENKVWKEVRDEINDIEKILKIKIGPTEAHHLIHRNFTSTIFLKHNLGEDFAEESLEAAEIRKSLG